MEKAKAERALFFRRFARSAERLEGHLLSKERTALSAEFEHFKVIYEKLAVAQNKYFSLWLDLSDQKDSSDEVDIDASEEYDIRFFTLKQQVKDFLELTTSPLSSHSTVTVKSNMKDKSSIGSKSKDDDNVSQLTRSNVSYQREKSVKERRRYRLPYLELPKFNGEVSKWISFWSQFRKIHVDETIDDDDKFHYLLQAMELGSCAREFVESFPPIGSNYHVVVEQLTQRYGRSELIIQHYVRELVQLAIRQSKESQKVPMRTLYDKISCQLLALETLNVPQENCSTFLYPLIESALSEDLLRVWNRIRDDTDCKTNPLSELLKFLRKEVESEERIRLGRSGLHENCSSAPASATCFTTTEKQSYNKQKQTTSLTSVKPEKSCIWCEKTFHTSSECVLATKKSLDERKEFLKSKNACTICLNIGHFWRKCRKHPVCIICGKRHFPIMCSNVNATKGQDDNKDVVNQAASPSSNKTVLLQTIKVNLIHSNGLFKIRALLDSGAQCSFIRSDVVKNLKLQPIGSRELSHNLFGGTVLEKQTYRLFNLNVCSLDGSRVCNIEALEHKTICGNLPRLQQNSKLSTRLRSLGIDISDCTDNISDISMLIGCDFLGSLYTGRSTRVDNNLLAVETLFGWTIQGPMVGVCCSVSNISTFSCTFNIEDFWKLETIGIRDESEVKNTKHLELEVMNFFEKTVRIDCENRYEVRLPWKDVSFSLKSNYAMALKRLMSTTSRLTHLGILNEYNDVFVEWLSTGVIEEVVCDDPDSGFYLPHHAVVKESSLTTKIRPVFDASSKDRNGLSLNVCLEKGKNLIELIPRLLIGFRKNAIGITSDIKKAFLQISLHPDDREYLKFLWWHDVKDKNKVLKVFRHRRVVFGITASPFLLSATILHHLNKFNSDTATLLSKSFYVDNSVVSVKNEIEMNKFISEAKAIMQEGMFELRCWVSGPVMVDEEIETTSVLGLMWNPRLDEIYCKRPYFKNDLEDNLTKRTVLSLAQAIFDPIGFMAPTILILKLVVQQCWILNIDWDQQIPDTLRRVMVSWLREVEAIELCRITRRFSSFDLDTCVNSLHIFCDASQSAYACCIFLRSESHDSVCLQLVLAKSRLAPTKSVTMPRLELLAALMGTRLASEAKEGLQLNCKEFYWTDSSIVLAWIKRKSGLNVFVHNRISEILLRTNAEDWHHIPGNMNPADLPSRGCNPEKLRQNRWWNGPDWLRKTPAEWPLSVEVPDQAEVEREVKKSCLTITVTGAPFSQRLTYFSKFSKIVRLIGWCLRLANRNLKSRGHDLTAEEYIGAEKRLLLALQKEDTSILNFNMHTFKDKDDFLRVKTRLTVSRNAEDFISPILLPAKNIIVERLVRQRHIDLLHAGSQTLISNLRETYWIIGIRRLVKRIVRECIICRRFTAKACSVPVAPLPDDRISCSSPFEATGIDLAGPLFLKNGTKCWIVLFTCATFRAVHLELCTSLSTEDFMLSLRRFLARRGKVRAIYSDNGTNLRGASNVLDSVNWEEVARKISVQKIAWHFIPPSAPWWGGFWERMVRTLKGILRRVLGKACLHFCELETVICEAEAVINSRPLTYIVDSTENLVPLSPSMFLNVSGYEHNIGFMDHVDGHVLTSRWRYLNKLSLDLKQRFRSEYLSLLVECKKGKPNELFKVGDVVLIGSDDIKRINWPLGIILEIYQGVDGASRVAKIKTVSGERVRALQRLYRLEVSCADKLVKATHTNPIPSTSETPPVVVTRSGRCVKVPNRLMY